MAARRRPPFLLALDQGTTSSRAIVFDAAGRRVGLGRSTLPQLYPQPGWVEHDPSTLWAGQAEAWRAALRAADLEPGAIAALGIANQRETTLVWERSSGRPVGNAIGWQDRRTAGLCRTLEAEGWAPLVAERTGLCCDPYFSATKLAWILAHTPGAPEAAARGDLLFGTVDTWLLWQLTAGRVHATDATNASRTMLWDAGRLQWDGDLLGRLGIPRAMLPEVRPSPGDFGRTDARVFGAEVPVTALAGDQQAALFGQGCWVPGAAKNTYGTGCFLLLHRGTDGGAVGGGLLRTVALWDGGRPEYAVEGSVFSAGSAVEWLCDLGLLRRPGELERWAATVADGGGAWVVPAFAGLGAPHWDPDARGTVVGLTRGTGRAHLCRAVLEAIAHQSRDVFALMCAQTGLSVPELRVDGGGARGALLLQVQADLLGVPVVRSAQVEGTALGAALLAGLGAGVWGGRAELARLVGGGTVFEPRVGEDERRRRVAQWRRAVERSRHWAQGAEEAGAGA